MGKVIHTTFQFKRGVAADWAIVNPILAAGEPGFELDTGLLKIGDGVNHFNDLEYIGANETEFEELKTDFETLTSGIGVVALGDAATQSVAQTIDSDGDLTTTNMVKTYVQSVVSQIVGFDYIVLDVGEELPAASTSTMHKIYLKPVADAAAYNYYEEYLTVESGEVGAKIYTWELIGTTQVDLSNYLDTAAEVAGVAFGNDKAISANELKAALGLAALAYKASASGTFDAVVGVNDITAAAAGEYSVTSTPVDVPQTFAEIETTPAGTVTVEYATNPSVSYDKAVGATISVSDISGSGTAYTPTGNVTLPNLDTHVTASNTTVAVVNSAGTNYSITPGGIIQAADTTAKFVIKGVEMSVNEQNEELVLRYVSNTDASFYASAVTAAGAITYSQPVLTGALPTFTTASVIEANGLSVTTSYNGSAVFSGASTYLGASVQFSSVAANVTPGTFSGAFSGSTMTFTPSVATTVSVAGLDGAVTISASTIHPTVQTSTQTITVS